MKQGRGLDSQVWGGLVAILNVVVRKVLTDVVFEPKA